ncbi:MAG: PKD repeat protein, partial [Arenicella sp.]
MQKYCTRVLQSIFFLFLISIFSLESMAQLAISVNGSAAVTGCGSLIVSHSVSGTDGARTISSVQWNLGTGNTPVGNPVNEVYGPGIFSVSVTVNYTTGASESTTANNVIEVFDSPTPSFDADVPGGCAPATVTFTNTTPFVSGATSWQTIQWEFSENGSIIGNTSGSPASFTFTNAGEFDVKLLVRDNNGCASTVNFADQIVIINDLVADFTPSTTQTTCVANLNVNFTNGTTTSATGSISYLWDFGDGTATSTDENPSHNFTGPGIYSVSLTATHDASICSDVEVKNQLIRVLEEDLGFQGNPLTGCTPFIVNFSDTSRFYSGAGQTSPVTV